MKRYAVKGLACGGEPVGRVEATDEETRGALLIYQVVIVEPDLENRTYVLYARSRGRGRNTTLSATHDASSSQTSLPLVSPRVLRAPSLPRRLAISPRWTAVSVQTSASTVIKSARASRVFSTLYRMNVCCHCSSSNTPGEMHEPGLKRKCRRSQYATPGKRRNRPVFRDVNAKK